MRVALMNLYNLIMDSGKAPFDLDAKTVDEVTEGRPSARIKNLRDWGFKIVTKREGREVVGYTVEAAPSDTPKEVTDHLTKIGKRAEKVAALNAPEKVKAREERAEKKAAKAAEKAAAEKAEKRKLAAKKAAETKAKNAGSKGKSSAAKKDAEVPADLQTA